VSYVYRWGDGSDHVSARGARESRDRDFGNRPLWPPFDVADYDGPGHALWSTAHARVVRTVSRLQREWRRLEREGVDDKGGPVREAAHGARASLHRAWQSPPVPVSTRAAQPPETPHNNATSTPRQTADNAPSQHAPTTAPSGSQTARLARLRHRLTERLQQEPAP
jgi:hypothetical protein